MSDCTNVEMRELLPELLHGRLDSVEAARVREHLAACAECATELELLQRVQRAYRASAPAVDTAAVVRALPAPRRQRRVVAFGLLKVAAALVVVVSGALVLRVAMNDEWRAVDSSSVVVGPVDTAAPPVRPEPEPVRAAPRAAGEERVLAMSLGELQDLDANELETLLGALDEIVAAPAAEPDTLLGSVRGIGLE